MRTMVTRNCQHCNTAFQAIPAEVNRGKAKFCSRKCSDLAKILTGPPSEKSKVDHMCPYCHKVFKAWTWEHRIFCSTGCYHESKVLPDPFWPHVEQTPDHWDWTGGHTEDGYGILTIRKKKIRAHRYSWELHKGPIPEGWDALHHCDRPQCVRPDHLYLGHDKENQEDRWMRGRGHNGEKSGMAKLTEVKVREIWALLAEGQMTQRAIAKQFDVSPALICLFKKGIGWNHLRLPSEADYQRYVHWVESRALTTKSGTETELFMGRIQTVP